MTGINWWLVVGAIWMSGGLAPSMPMDTKTGRLVVKVLDSFYLAVGLHYVKWGMMP